MKALLPFEGDPHLPGFEYLANLEKIRITPNESGLITNANLICLSNSKNAVFCNRVSILEFFKRKSGIIFPHNNGSSQEKGREIDSS
jgi:hypothetical protein